MSAGDEMTEEMPAVDCERCSNEAVYSFDWNHLCEGCLVEFLTPLLTRFSAGKQFEPTVVLDEGELSGFQLDMIGFSKFIPIEEVYELYWTRERDAALKALAGDAESRYRYAYGAGWRLRRAVRALKRLGEEL